jgi:hypothetical protein
MTELSALGVEQLRILNPVFGSNTTQPLLSTGTGLRSLLLLKTTPPLIPYGDFLAS